MRWLNRNVRFTPESRHRLSARGCPLCATSGHSALLRMFTADNSYRQCRRSTSVRHAVKLPDRAEVVDPGLLRANKYLPTRHQFISLTKRANAHVVGFWLIASRCCMDRRPALRAESLHTDVSTIGGLSIFR